MLPLDHCDLQYVFYSHATLTFLPQIRVTWLEPGSDHTVILNFVFFATEICGHKAVATSLCPSSRGRVGSGVTTQEQSSYDHPGRVMAHFTCTRYVTLTCGAVGDPLTLKSCHVLQLMCSSSIPSLKSIWHPVLELAFPQFYLDCEFQVPSFTFLGKRGSNFIFLVPKTPGMMDLTNSVTYMCGKETKKNRNFSCNKLFICLDHLRYVDIPQWNFASRGSYIFQIFWKSIEGFGAVGNCWKSPCFNCF